MGGDEKNVAEVDTTVDRGKLVGLLEAQTFLPEDFHPHPKIDAGLRLRRWQVLGRFLCRRRLHDPSEGELRDVRLRLLADPSFGYTVLGTSQVPDRRVIAIAAGAVASAVSGTITGTIAEEHHVILLLRFIVVCQFRRGT